MNWLPVGKRDEPWPDAIRKLDKKHGVYAIRRRGLIFTEVLYVGESHKGSLYKTLTRHFQSWSRGKKWWVGQYTPAQTDPGHTYERTSQMEVAFETSSATRAVELQLEWIRKLKPRDNVALVDDKDEVPF